MIVRQANRRHRKMLANLLRQGTRSLRVIGSTKAGFTLIAEGGSNHEGTLTPCVVGPVEGFKKQADAIAYGQAHFGQQARKVVVKAAA